MKIDLAMPIPVEIDNLQRIDTLQDEITHRLHVIPSFNTEPTTFVLNIKYMQLDFVVHVWRELCHLDAARAHDRVWREENNNRQGLNRKFSCGSDCSIKIELIDLICEESLPFILRKLVEHDFQQIKVIDVTIVEKNPSAAVRDYQEKLNQKNIPTKILSALTNGVHVETLKLVGVFSDKRPANGSTIQPEPVVMTI